MFRQTLSALTLTLALGTVATAVEPTPAPAEAEVYIISPQDGETVTSPVTVLFGMRGMGIAPAGVQQDGTGHHHLFIDRPPFGDDEAAMTIPADETHIHFGGGQTETEIELDPGRHTLQLVAGDHNHVPHDPPIVSDVVTITVQ